ncbi:MAG TPA: cell division protein FtsZ [Burkholderiaceae bacterium]|nr:cell division protein FtsZ [Burkholderiaceae bacterium]
MGTLQLSLAALGGVVLAAIVAHGAWTARRAEVKRVTDAAPAPAQEPSLGDPLPPRAEADAGAGMWVDGPPADAATSGPVPLHEPGLARRQEPVLTARRAGARLDSLIDALATLKLDHPVSGDHALPLLPPTRRAGSKPFHVEGLNAETGAWESPQAGARYSEFQAGVQLANRTGALNEIEYSEFVQKVQAFADALGALPDFPDMLDVVARARELDHFASQHDAQLALRLAARGSAWSPGYVQQHAARHGFVSGALPGRLVLAGAEEGAPPVLTLQYDAQAALAEDPSQSALRELTLSFDVPQTPSAQHPFSAWCASGEALALALDAALYDDGGQPLHPSAFAAIEHELTRLYEALAARDLAVGSSAARRLFS